MESNGIALLDLTHFVERPSKEIEIRPYELGVQYIALSHVWSEGMGNPETNSLPSCYLRYLARMARGILSEGDRGNTPLLVWLDTLCCPVASKKHRELCLQSMRRIYEEADHVLVVSAALRDYTADQIDCIEICARLMFSSWMTRLWTLQEGALARKLWVGLKDKPIDMSLIETALNQICEQSLVHRPVSLYLLWYFQYIRKLYSDERKQGRYTGTEYLRKILLSRAVTVSTDEPLCLATLLDVPPQSIVNCRPLDRMAEFWKMMSSSGRKIPRRIIFCRSPRLLNTGFRWSPTSLLRQDMTHIRAANSADAAVLSTEGLRFSWPGCSMRLTMPLSADNRAVADGFHENWRSWHNDRTESIEYTQLMLFRHPNLGWFQASDQSKPPVGKQSMTLLDTMRACVTSIGVILEGDLRELHRQNDTIRYLAGEITRRDGGTIYLLPGATGIISKLDPMDQKQYENGWAVLKEWKEPETPQTSLEESSAFNANIISVMAKDQKLREACARGSRRLGAEGYKLSEAIIRAGAFRIALLEGCEVQEDFNNQQNWCLI